MGHQSAPQPSSPGCRGNPGFLRDPSHLHMLASISNPRGPQLALVCCSLALSLSLYIKLGVPCQFHATDPETSTTVQAPSPSWGRQQGFPGREVCRERPGACRVGGCLLWPWCFILTTTKNPHGSCWMASVGTAQLCRSLKSPGLRW